MELLELFRDIALDELKTLKEDISANITAKLVNASGNLIASLDIKPTGDGAELWGNNYIEWAERGRGPGNIPKGFKNKIREWAVTANARGILDIKPIPYVRRESENWKPKYTPEERGFNQFYYFYSKKLREEGSYVHRQGGRTNMYTDAMNETIERIKTRCEKELHEFIINDLNKLI